MKRIVMVAALAAILAGCTHSHEDLKTTVEAMGMKDVVSRGYPLWGCPEDDNIRTSFEATTAQGQRVRGVVCGAPFKGNTVRIMGRA
jgi:hypothetical protein